jgi:RNA polymerase sigma-70 factor (ECF subfamily)
MLEIVNSSDRFDEERDFLAWAKGIARNVVRRHWDSQKRTPSPVEAELLNTAADIMADESEPDIWEKEKIGLRRCLGKLTEKYQRLFQLRYAENLKGPGLARAMDMKLKSLRTTLMRIRTLLRDCITMQVNAINGGGAPGE